MTRKKGVALIICLTLIIGMALPGTLAFSGDPSATNENLTLADDPPVPTPENSVAETGCTCDPKPAEGEAHQADCPLYTEPEVPAEEETTCTCNPQPAEGEAHKEGCPFYNNANNALSPEQGAPAAAEGTDSPVTESAAGQIRIKINVFCVDDDGKAAPQPGVPVEVRRDLHTPYYGDGKPLPDWSDGLSMFRGTSGTGGVVYIEAPYTVVKDPDKAANDTVYLGSGNTNDNDHVVYQRAANEDAGYPIRFAIVPAQGSGYELNDESEVIRNWKTGINGTPLGTQNENAYGKDVYYDDFTFDEGLIDSDKESGSGAFIEFDLYVKKTASTEEPPEETVDINYVLVGPAGATNFGSVDTASETVMVKSGTAGGSTPTPGTGFKFVGWYKDEDCTEAVNENWVTGNMLKPDKTKNYGTAESPVMGYEAATYYAKFDYDVANLTINKTGCQDIDENQSFIFDVTSPNGYSKRVVIKGTDSVTITGLKVGEYTVTEVTSWSWRYSTTGGSQQRITLQGAQTNNAVSFTNNVSNSKWLSGNAYSKIVFGNK